MHHALAAVTLRRLRLAPWHLLPWLAAIAFLLPAPFARAQLASTQAEADPPGRVAHLSYRKGGVVFAPEGEDEWVDLPQNRPLTTGDRLWSDRGARAELQLGSATLHLDGESHVGIGALDDAASKFIVMQGAVNARVRELAPGENFELGTPNLALRATQPGDFRIDVGPDGRQTRVVVLSGMATVFGEGGDSLHLGAGQQATFAGRFLAPVQGQAWRSDEFAQWAAGRNLAEDQSAAARHVPRGVVGYAQLDQHGTWGTDATHGTVWYPQVASTDWAPYRDGRWEWVRPWGWTWVDDAPWGFAPFHYGRWAQIGPRWAWVPGRLAARPVYSPALVVFMGGAGFGDGPGVGWYPLAPGEAWWPSYRVSQRYVNHVNIHIDLNRYPRHYDNHWFRHRHHAVTAVRVDDFRSGRGVRGHWRPMAPGWSGQAQIGAVPQRPDRRMERPVASARLQAAPPSTVQQTWPSPPWGQRGDRHDRRDDRREDRREMQPSRPVQPAWGAQERQGGDGRGNAVREQERAQREQQRLQHDAERTAREQQWRQQRNDAVRQQQEQAVRQQQEQAVRRQAQQLQMRQQQDAAWQQQAQELAQRQQQRLQDDRARGRQAPPWPQQMAPQQAQPQGLQPQVQQQQAAPIGRPGRDDDDARGRGREGREGRGGRDRREGGEGRGPRDDDGQGRGRGERQGGWQRNG